MYIRVCSIEMEALLFVMHKMLSKLSSTLLHPIGTLCVDADFIVEAK